MFADIESWRRLDGVAEDPGSQREAQTLCNTGA